jgi:hypothetical protein
MSTRRRRTTLLTVLLLVVSSLGMANAAGREKVTICHIPPGNPGNAHTISVGAPAVPAHLGHGDTLGRCADDPNIPPEADAGEDQCVLFGDEATLDGSGSHDPDGGPDPLSYEWTLQDAPAGSTVTLSDPNVAQPTFTPDRLGDYEFELMVSDGADDDTDTTVVTSYMDVTLDSSVYEMFVTQAVEVEVMIHTAAPEGGAELAIVIGDPELAVASLVDENEVIDSITIEEGETSALFELTGLADGETTLMVGDPTCDGVADAEVDVEALPLQELAEELEIDEEELAEQLEELLEFDGVTLPDFESSDLWQDVTDALDAIGAVFGSFFESLSDV